MCPANVMPVVAGLFWGSTGWIIQALKTTPYTHVNQVAIKPEQENKSRLARSVIREYCTRLHISGFTLTGDSTSKRAGKEQDLYCTKIPSSCQVADWRKLSSALKQWGTEDANCCTRALCAWMQDCLRSSFQSVESHVLVIVRLGFPGIMSSFSTQICWLVESEDISHIWPLNNSELPRGQLNWLLLR